ncbi:hypothetical protein M758_UG197500 [Ceratodon purpureus]|nr:hypothetical protein M758_UG197500 [Ceratodon purpureus]
MKKTFGSILSHAATTLFQIFEPLCDWRCGIVKKLQARRPLATLIGLEVEEAMSQHEVKVGVQAIQLTNASAYR